MFKRTFFIAVACLVTFSAYAEKKDIVKIGGDVVVEEQMTVNDAVVIGGDLKIKGEVAGDAIAIFGDVDVEPGAMIGGSAVAIFGRVIKMPGAVVSRDTFQFSFGRVLNNMNCTSCVIPIVGAGAFWMILLTASVGFLALFLLISIFFTGKIGVASYYAEKNLLRSLWYGFVVLILMAPLTIFLIISIIGIPLIPLLFILFSAVTLFGYTAMCQLIGMKFFKAIKKRGQPMFLEVVVGFILLLCVVMIPFVGWLIKPLVWMTGMGATIATKFGTK